VAIQVNVAEQNIQKTIQLVDSGETQNLFGVQDENLRILREHSGARIVARGEVIKVSGRAKEVDQVISIFENMLKLYRNGERITTRDMEYMIASLGEESAPPKVEEFTPITMPLRSRKGMVKPRTPGQRKYINNIAENDIVFGIGPAGTGKTYLAVATAVCALQRKQVRRIILARPAVEAGESLGFLPGDLQAKVDPFLRPLYDGLYDMLHPDLVQRYLDERIVEIAPLAYMRGRTLNNSFVILDEAQNTTKEQMKMFLTRIGLDSKAVITGDITQIDLPSGRESGLIEVCNLLKNIEGIGFTHMNKHDIVRHPLVRKIVAAYEENNHDSQSILREANESTQDSLKSEGDKS